MLKRIKRFNRKYPSLAISLASVVGLATYSGVQACRGKFSTAIPMTGIVAAQGIILGRKELRIYRDMGNRIQKFGFEPDRMANETYKILAGVYAEETGRHFEYTLAAQRSELN